MNASGVPNTCKSNGVMQNTVCFGKEKSKAQSVLYDLVADG